MRDLPCIGARRQFVATFLAAVILTGCQTAAEVDQALYTAANFVSERDRVTGKRTLNLVRRPEQIRKANAEIESLIQKLRIAGKPLNAEVDAEAYARVTRILGRIHAVSHFAQENWKVLLVPDRKFNAWVNGGTYVVVNIGLFGEVQSDDEISAILGHEMGHVAANHLFEQAAHGLALGLAKSGSAKRQGYSEAYTALHEQEADRIGVLYAALAGYDPHAASRIWERFSQKRTRQWAFFRSHPAYPERTGQTRKAAAEVAQYYRPNSQNPEYAKILACNSLWCRSDDKAQPGKGGGVAAIINSTVNLYVKHQKAKTERKRQEAEIARERVALSGRGFQRGALALRLRGQQVVSGDVVGPITQRTYRGHATGPRGNQPFVIDTQFAITKLGQLVGRYAYRQGYRKLSGRMVAVANDPDGALAFTWQTGITKGWVLLRFQPDGSTFNGQWGYAGKTTPIGRWSGTTIQ